MARGKIIDEYRGPITAEWSRSVCKWNKLKRRPAASGEPLPVDVLAARLDAATAAPIELAEPIVIRKCDGVVKSGRDVLLAVRDTGAGVIATVCYVDDGLCDIPGQLTAPRWETKVIALEPGPGAHGEPAAAAADAAPKTYTAADADDIPDELTIGGFLSCLARLGKRFVDAVAADEDDPLHLREHGNGSHVRAR